MGLSVKTIVNEVTIDLDFENEKVVLIQGMDSIQFPLQDFGIMARALEIMCQREMQRQQSLQQARGMR